MQKVGAEIDLAKAKFGVLKGHVECGAADMRIRFAHVSDDLDVRFADTRAKFSELGDASEDAFDRVKVAFENSWNGLGRAVKDALAKFSP